MENINWNINLDFDIKKHKANVIKVIGVGGAGGNAVNYMYQKGIKDVDFVVINTDAQDLAKSPIPIKVQIGRNLTEGLGAGAVPEIGEKAALEDEESIRKVLEDNTKMIFITAGMGGGTGTGAAPIIAKIAKELGILTVGIVTSPFVFEGKKRITYAEEGIEKMRENVDSLIIVNNNKLREVFGNLTYGEAFSKSDEILANAASSISEVITHNFKVNVDFRDVRTVLENSGTAIMGSAIASGENRAQKVIETALDSPLLNDNNIKGAKNVLLLIVSGETDFTLDEMNEINHFVQEEANNSADIILGIGKDERLKEDEIGVTIIATGFPKDQQDMISNTKPDRKIHYIKKDTDIIKNIPTDIATNNEDETIEPKVELDEFGYKQTVLDFENDLVAEPKPKLSVNDNLSTDNEITNEEKTNSLNKNDISENNNTKDENENKKNDNKLNNNQLSLFPDDEEIKKPKKVYHLSNFKKKEEKLEKEQENTEKIKQENTQKRINFVRKESGYEKESKIEVSEDEIDDITELPFEIALKIAGKRKQNLANYSDKIELNGIDDKPAFEKKGIEVDLTPKSDKTTKRIEMDRNGNFNISDSNTFFNPGLD